MRIGNCWREVSLLYSCFFFNIHVFFVALVPEIQSPNSLFGIVSSVLIRHRIDLACSYSLSSAELTCNCPIVANRHIFRSAPFAAKRTGS